MSELIEPLRTAAVWLLVAALPVVIAFVVLQIRFRERLRTMHPGYMEASSPQLTSVFAMYSPLARRVLLSQCYRELDDAVLNQLGAWTRRANRLTNVLLYGAAAAAFGPVVLRNLAS